MSNLVLSVENFPKDEHIAVITFSGAFSRNGVDLTYRVFDDENDLKTWVIQNPLIKYQIITAIPKNVSVDVKIS